ncbi:MAG: peptidase [Proteobacteria bacterium]|nr:peptidase [Pseudomonadota bacterium]
MKRELLCFAALAALLAGQAQASAEGDMTIKRQLAKFAPVKIEVEGGLLDARQKKLVAELVKAARFMDEIFLRQVYSGNAKLRERLEARAARSPEIYEYFLVNYGPFDRLDHDRPFVAGVGVKPAGANYYPEDMTKREFASWIKKRPADREPFESNFTAVRRSGQSLVAVPYSEEYREFLVPAAASLRKASRLASNASLKRYLAGRADAFFSNDYFPSDVDWVRMKGHDIEVAIGPYEVYEDRLFGYKAAFEAFVTRVDPKESRRLAKVVRYLDELEANLPIEDRHKGRGRSLSSPIVVAQLIYSAGDTRAGVQTLAFNLPNDERVRRQEGSKKVMLKNVQRAKYEKILLPIAGRVMSGRDAAGVDFEAFFAHTLLHEVSHGIGPGEIEIAGEKTTVNKALSDLYSLIEECKADTLGLYNAIYLAAKGLYPEGFIDSVWPTYLAGIFRSVRFGIGEAHGGANAMQFNYLVSKGAIRHDRRSGLFSIDRSKIESAVRDLASELLVIEATGDYAAAKKFVDRHRRMPAEMRAAIARLSDVPVDIRPRYAFD